jgi:hypothetical protein
MAMAGEVECCLYVLAEPAQGQEGNKNFTTWILGNLTMRSKALEKRGVRVAVHRVSRVAAKDERLAEAFRKKGIENLPALVCGGRVFEGCQKISSHFELMSAPAQKADAKAAAPRGGEGEDEVEAFYRQLLEEGPGGLPEDDQPEE